MPIALAATVLVMHDGRSGPEVLLVRRASSLAFHGGAWVFPGGRVDPADDSDGDELATARRAAVREAREEAGLVLAPESLVPFSHWTTPPGRARRFATWFFAVRLETPLDVVVDGEEIRAHRWLAPREALALQARRELELPPPTFVTLTILEQLGLSSSAALLARLREAPPEIYVPHLHAVPDGEVTLYDGDVAYESGALTQPGPRHRLSMLASGWRYERSGEVA